MSMIDDVRRVIADTLNLSEDKIDENSSSETIDAWDSLAQVNLMMAIEQTFDLELEVEDFMKLNSVSAIAGFIEANS
ncbi:MAG: acyl carrier protein [Gammaproteobacteria bacterium]|nr:acyl carrier protein [Gammaproteobacteria bacterium]